MSDFATLAQELVGVLAPLLPVLKGAGKALSEGAGKTLGAEAFEKVKALWTKLRPRVEEKEAAREAVEDLATRPDDQRVRGAAEVQIEKILTAHPVLAAEVAELLRAVGPRAVWVQAGEGSALAIGDHSVAASRGGIAAGGNVTIGGAGPKVEGTDRDE